MKKIENILKCEILQLLYIPYNVSAILYKQQLKKIKLLYDSLASEQHLMSDTNINVFDPSGNLLVNFNMINNQPEHTNIKYNIDFVITHTRLNKLIQEEFKYGITKDDMFMFNIAYANYKYRIKNTIKINVK